MKRQAYLPLLGAFLLDAPCRGDGGLSLQYIALHSDFRGVQTNYERALPFWGESVSWTASLAGYWRYPEAHSGTWGWSAGARPKWYFTDKWNLSLPLAYTHLAGIQYASMGMAIGRKFRFRRLFFEAMVGHSVAIGDPVERKDDPGGSNGLEKGHAFGLEALDNSFLDYILSWAYPNLGADLDLAIGFRF